MDKGEDKEMDMEADEEGDEVDEEGDEEVGQEIVASCSDAIHEDMLHDHHSGALPGCLHKKWVLKVPSRCSALKTHQTQSWILTANNIRKLDALSSCIHCISQECSMIDGSFWRLEKPRSVISNLRPRRRSH